MMISFFPPKNAAACQPTVQYDIEKGLLLKLDSFLQIQLGSVYRGLSRVPDEEVLNLYRNRIIPIAYVEGEKGDVRLFACSLSTLPNGFTCRINPFRAAREK